MTARAVVIDRPGELRVAAADPVEPGPGEALVRIAWSGICGSDRELFTGGRPDGFVRYPVVPGHEWSGTVLAVGPDVPADYLGHHVVGEGFRGCQSCDACRRGENNLCTTGYAETGFTSPGAWCDHLLLPARLLHVLPPEADLRAAAVLEPAACVGEACLRLGGVAGERVAVVGGGSLGLLGAQLLGATGPAELVVVEPRAGREELAEACGATAVLTPLEAVRRCGRFDAVLETAGTPGAAHLATRLARRGGRVALTGLPPESDSLVTARLVSAQLTLHTVFGAPSRAWTHVVRLFTAGVLDPGRIITHEFDLADAATALDLLTDSGSQVGKILLTPGSGSERTVRPI
ncbi:MULTISPECIES: zinc-binding dehydrogenase [Saccharopolyspora]|uniref:Alcohol dehydrogenase catalytic domain-containing protein n=1 Tax=Saccharopolyspora gregorii TaxID=33914 RepID=A0ABP6RUY7_9PSEU|nr:MULTISPECIES: alcohol dehydrogenase catalytic domain-containing protein [unclassified Saccharopolyspora]MCA1189736.1 alcohol dehydrogenase catalytic domain-containing protein [Saccharopolyspora sp. 6T]MCA1193961.1 alcohol dehydrogenase catalytic domain-containing protein [Saccharopolyspora sp. 6V]MCA1228657.1 alcohol dehydrogenase catalytic domain-containing protein [Saccharopolyspora sp. 6M]MCA1279308.1 alcohol dehydrogenase catalytic domain-containing protein [Saccharopolyspora sp. 7B]